ncbi:MAG: DNA-protecting protein DprA [Planctomycetota bacterium]|nr:MAG: DNA-protecting protein DprA [Planctomycetota bacterium]
MTASENALKYLRLTMVPEVGPIRFASLLRELGGIDAVLGASVAMLASAERVGPRIAENIARLRDKVDVASEVALAERHGVRIICLVDDEYPVALSRIDDPPPCIYIKGKLDRRDVIALAIVGSRSCSRYGAEQAERFGALAANAGMTVVSGMARGVDSFAHRGALAAGGRTLAVVGCGLSHVYPPDAVEMSEQIAQHGAVISELPMCVAPDAKNFPPRNRIIAGLSLGVLVVEAAKRSGALLTAHQAIDYNREVFALAGRVDTPQAAGCLDLIKKGAAKLATRFEDILEEFGAAGKAMCEAAAPQPPATLSDSGEFVAMDEPEKQIVAALAADALGVDDLCEQTGLPPSRVAVALTALQLKGVVRRLLGEKFERTARKCT